MIFFRILTYLSILILVICPFIFTVYVMENFTVERDDLNKVIGFKKINKKS